MRSILYATDLGLYAPYVFQHALNLARRFDAELNVIHVVEPIGLFARTVLDSYLDDDTRSQLRDNGLSSVMGCIEQRVLEAFREECIVPEDYRSIHGVRVVQGDPPVMLIDQANDLRVDAIVIGSHSQSASRITPLGRTALRVLQAAPVPVYMVPMLKSSKHKKPAK